MLKSKYYCRFQQVKCFLLPHPARYNNNYDFTVVWHRIAASEMQNHPSNYTLIHSQQLVVCKPLELKTYEFDTVD